MNGIVIRLVIVVQKSNLKSVLGCLSTERDLSFKMSESRETLRYILCNEAWTVKSRVVYISKRVPDAREDQAQPGFNTCDTADC